MPQVAWRGRIFLDAGLIMYVGPGAGADEHEHNAVQFVWSIDGPIDVTLDGNPLKRTAILIPANTVHTLDASGHVIVLLLVESHGTRGVALDEVAKREDGRELASRIESVPLPTQDVRSPDVSAWSDGLLAALGVASGLQQLGIVTRRAISHIEASLDGVPRVADVANKLSLSETRVTHLFSDEVGIPFRRFVLWTRIKRAVALHRSCNDLTTAAIGAGFSDAAHFSRTFRSMFGLSPSLVLPVAELVGNIWTER